MAYGPYPDEPGPEVQLRTYEGRPTQAPPRTAEEVAGVLEAIVGYIGYLDPDEEPELGEGALSGATARSFAERGLLTRDAGLVLTLADGTEYQLTVVRSN